MNQGGDMVHQVVQALLLYYGNVILITIVNFLTIIGPTENRNQEVNLELITCQFKNRKLITN